MADPNDTSSMWGDMTGPLSNAFGDFTSSMTPDHIFSSDFLGRAANGTVAAAKKAAKESAPVATKNPYEEYFSRDATIGNFNRGDSLRVGLEQTKPPSRTEPTRAENPQEVYLQWYNNMKRFAYGA